MKQRSQPPQASAAKRILIGYLGLYPTLLLVLTLLGPVTHDLSFPSRGAGSRDPARVVPTR